MAPLIPSGYTVLGIPGAREMGVWLIGPESLPMALTLTHLRTSPCLKFTSQDLASYYGETPEKAASNSSFPLTVLEAETS